MDELVTAWSVEIRDEDGEWVDTINVVMPIGKATLESALTEGLRAIRED